MIELIFYFGNEIVFVRINGKEVRFANNSRHMITDIGGLRLSQEGVIKEFPDLKDNKDWRVEAVKRFNEKILSLGSEEKISVYIIKELKKCGYTPRYRQRKGFRVEVIK